MAMSRQTLINAILNVTADNAKVKLTRKMAGEITDAVFDTLRNQLRIQGQVRVGNFGTFRISKRSARVGINPATGEKLDIPETRVVKFKPALSFKTEIKNIELTE